MKYTYRTHDTCSSQISFDIQGETITNIRFTGGCDGNLKAIPILVNGWTATDIAKKCAGITCGNRLTSCADQLATAVTLAKEKSLSC